jgi:hypothetical protein
LSPPWSDNAGRLELIGAADLNGDPYLDNNIVIWRRLRAPLFRLTGPWPRLELVGLKAPSDSPLNLARFDDRHWMTTEKPIWFIAEYPCEIPHISLLTPAMKKILRASIAAHYSAKWWVTEKDRVLSLWPGGHWSRHSTNLFWRTHIGVRFYVAPLLVHDAAQFALHGLERVMDDFF